MACGGGGGRPARVKGWRWGEQEEGCGWKSSCWVVGRGSALNTGPQLGFHNDISGGQAEPSTVQMGKLRRGLLQCLGREGASHQLLRTIHLSHEDTMTWSWNACQWSLSVQIETQEWKAAGSPGSRHPLYSGQTRGAPSPTSAAGRGRAGLRRLPARLPSPAHVPAKGSF